MDLALERERGVGASKFEPRPDDRGIKIKQTSTPPPDDENTPLKYSTPVRSRGGCFRFSRFRMSSVDSESIRRVRQGLPSRALDY